MKSLIDFINEAESQANLIPKSSVLNDDYMKNPKKSLLLAYDEDKVIEFNDKMLNYVDGSSMTEDDEFFYDMMPMIRFLKNDGETTAYTTPEKLICLNSPGVFGENVQWWLSIYNHECLHQLWDTFGVGERIKAEGKEYNHTLLNIASDCVINDYLIYYRKRKFPDGLITPQSIKKEFGVDYDRREDTQYTLYLKLLEVKQKIEQSPEFQKMKKEMEEQEKREQQSSSQSGQGQSGQGQSGQGQSGQEGEGQEGEGQEGEGQEGEGQEGKGQEGQGKEGQGKEGQGKEGQGQEGQGKEGQGKEGQGKEGQGKEGQGKEGQGKEGQGKEGQNSSGSSYTRNGKGGKIPSGTHRDGTLKESGNSITLDMSPDELKKISKEAENICKKYKDRISGDFGRFIDQCVKSAEMKDTRMTHNNSSGASSWNQKVQQTLNVVIKKKIFQKQREYKKTYARPNRRAGVVKSGGFIQKGKTIKKDQLTISMAFYTDVSGSMYNCIKEVINATYRLFDMMKKTFGRNDMVDDINAKFYVFNDWIKEIKYGQKVTANGGNVDLPELMKGIEKRTPEYMFNIIITDGGFGAGNLEKSFKKLDGMVLFIQNEEGPDFKQIEKDYPEKFKYIQADADFTVKSLK